MTTVRPVLPLTLSQLAAHYFTAKLSPRLVRPDVNYRRLIAVLAWMYAQHQIDDWLKILPCHWAEYNHCRELVDIAPETRRKELQELVRFLRFCEQLNPDGPSRSHLFEG